MFDNIVPPNLDVICQNQFSSSSVYYPATSTCSYPINYYIGHTWDLGIIFLFGVLTTKFLLKFS